MLPVALTPTDPDVVELEAAEAELAAALARLTGTSDAPRYVRRAYVRWTAARTAAGVSV